MITRVIYRAGVFHIEGRLDELVDFGEIAKAAARPIKLNFAKVASANSWGVRSFVNFVADNAGYGMEFHECSAAIMDVINSIPASLGNPPQPGIVKSLIASYHCDHCMKDEDVILRFAKPPAELPEMPERLCKRCQNKMRSEQEAEDLFTYIIAGD